MCMTISSFCFFNDTATTEIYTYCHTLSLHDALPIYLVLRLERDALLGVAAMVDARVDAERGATAVHMIGPGAAPMLQQRRCIPFADLAADRKSTRLNSSH